MVRDLVKTLIIGVLMPVAAFSTMAMAPAEMLRDRLIADARATPPSSLVFERTTVMRRASPISKSTVTRVERWDGRAWTLESVDGRKPSSSEAREAQKLAAAAPMPGYHRLAAMLATAADTSIDAQGRTVLHIPRLPAGTITNGKDDLSEHMMADATIGDRNGQPWVQRFKVSARERFKMGPLITVTTFEQVSDYKLDSNGNPRIAAEMADSVGSMFGQTGGESRQITYAYR